jgi:hypothetical protein
VSVLGGRLIDRIPIAYMILVGIVAGVILVVVPHATEFRLPPYFWVLLAVGAFDLAAYTRGRGGARHDGRNECAIVRVCACPRPDGRHFDNVRGRDAAGFLTVPPRRAR